MELRKLIPEFVSKFDGRKEEKRKKNHKENMRCSKTIGMAYLKCMCVSVSVKKGWRREE